MKKRILSLLFVCLLLCSLLPVAALAEGDPLPEETPDQPVATQKPSQPHLATEVRQAAAANAKSSSADLFEGFVKRQMGKRAPKNSEKASDAGEGLKGPLAAVYTNMVPELHKIAIGQRASTRFEFDLTKLGEGKTFYWTAEHLGVDHVVEDGSLVDEFWEEFESQMMLLYVALKADCPYDLYWHDVIHGFTYGFNSYSIGDETEWIEITGLRFGLCVDTAYQDGNAFTVNTTIGATVVTAGNNSRAIVSKYADRSDYEKLRGYNKEICNAVEYDHNAVYELNAGTLTHGDPWQLIWAFDGDPTTNIVCEGYSKAFQHLCDLTNFNNKTVRSIIVSGYAGGDHMWNVVCMEDGKRYLMDVTWSDGSSGQEAYFLKCADGGTYPTYRFYGDSRTFDAQTQKLYGEEKLTLSNQEYTPSSIEITAQPKSVTVVEGKEAVFTVTATGVDISYQWYSRASKSAAWTPLDGETTNKLTLIASMDHDGWQYHCLLKNPDGEVISDTATLHVKLHTHITFTAQPKNAKVKAGAKAKFSVKVKQKGVTYQWYSKAPGDTEWTAVAGATKATLTVVGVTGNSGSQYRCGVTNKGTEVFSKAATLTVTPVKPKIKTQPKTAKVKSGAKAKFTVKATGPHLQYQWYKCAPGSDSWEPIPGATAATYSFTAAKTDNGWQYRCVVKNEDGSVTTKTVKVSVKLSLPKFSAQPKSAKVKSGTLVKLKVKVKGKGVSYQWYARSSKDGAWEKIDGATSATYSVTVTAANSGYQYRCEARNADGAKYSKAATLKLK